MSSKVVRINAFLVFFLFNFFSSGNIILNSVLYENVKNSDGFSNTLTGLLFMLPYTTTRIFGPAVSVFMNYINPRILATFGSFLFGLGFCCCGLLPLQPIYMYPCFILSGIGLAFLNLPSIWFLEKSFGVNFRSVMPLALLGSFAGMVIIPNIAAFSAEEYGTGPTLLLFGASGWHLIPCGLLLPKSVSLGPTISDNQHRNMKADGSQCIGSVTSEAEEKEGRFSIYMTSLKKAIRRMLSVMTDEIFILFLIAANLRKLPNDVWTLFWIPRVQEVGLSLQIASAVGSIGGIGGIVGRFVAALSFKTSEDVSLILFCFYFVINGFTFIITELLLINFQGAVQLCFASFCNGLFLSAQSGMAAGVLHLLITSEQYVGAYGLVELGNGICTILAGVVPGLLKDSSVGFQTIFITLGLIGLVNGLFVVVMIILIFCKKHPNYDTKKLCCR